MASQLLGIKTRFTNDLGSPLVGGQVYTYFAGTSTNQDSYSDSALTVPNTNPVILDDTGSADIFLKGAYRIRVFDKSGRFIEEQDNVTQAASQGDTTELSNKVNAVEVDLSKVKFDTGITATAKFGGVTRTQAEKNSDTVSIKDFGALGLGLVDESQYFINAAAYAYANNAIITIPKGIYRISQSMDLPPMLFVGDSMTSVILLIDADTTAPIFNFAGAADNEIGLTIGVNKATINLARNASTLFKTPKDGTQYLPKRTNLSFEDLRLTATLGNTDSNVTGGSWQNFGFTKAFELGDCWQGWVQRVMALGDFDISVNPITQRENTLLHMDAASHGSLKVSQVQCNNYRTGYILSNRYFIQMSSCDQAHGYDGFIVSDEAGVVIYGEGHITDCLFNAQNRGVYMHNKGWVTLTNVNINRHKDGWKGATTDWYGLYLVDCEKSWVNNIRTQVDNSKGDFGGIANGVYYKDCKGITSSGLKIGTAIDRSITIDGGEQLQFPSADFQGSKGVAWTFKNGCKNLQIGLYTRAGGVATEFDIGADVNMGTMQIFNRSIQPESAQPNYWWRESDGGADSKYWRMYVNNGILFGQTMNDAESANDSWLVVTRSANTIAKTEIKGTSIHLNAATTLTQQLSADLDNRHSCGTAALRWSTVYAATGTINTSDERLKTEFDSVSAAEKRAALKIKKSIGRYQFTDAVDEKGNKARYHFGVGAQTVGQIMRDEGLNPDEYAFYCYDEWQAQDEVITPEGNKVSEATEAGNRYGIRYDELAMFILAAI